MGDVGVKHGPNSARWNETASDQPPRKFLKTMGDPGAGNPVIMKTFFIFKKNAISVTSKINN